MKFGYLVFSYTNFQQFQRRLSGEGYYTINLGDYMQTLAVRSLYRRLGIADVDTLAIDRDTIAKYSGPPVMLPMNGCFHEWHFPLPHNVKPIFIGFQCNEAVVIKQRQWLQQHQPIGCRDEATAKLFRKHGITANVTGCLTLSLERRPQEPSQSKTLVVHGSGAGAFPSAALHFMPQEIWPTVEFVSQRKPFHTFPLGAPEMGQAEMHAQALLEYYKSTATLVISPLHHAVTPALALGVPVILCRSKDESRFSLLKDLTHMYLPDNFPEINWNPPLDNIEHIREKLIQNFKVCLETPSGFKSAYSPYSGSLATAPKLFRFLRGRHCTVFGSAPGRQPPSGYENTVMVCINGSATGLSRPPDLTVIGAQVSRAHTKTCRHTLRRLNGGFSKRVLFVHPGKLEDYEDRYRDFGWSWDESEVMSAEQRADFIYELTGYRTGGLTGHHAHSNGILATLLTAAAGASRIDMCGFSFSSGHFYIEGETARNHVDHDANAFEWLAKHAPIRSADHEIRERFGIPPID